MVKLVSGGCGVDGAEMFDVGGCCMSWKCRLRRPNVRSARSGRAGLSRKRRCTMNESWSAVSVGSMNLMVSIWMGTYLLVDLEGCPAVKFPGVEYVCGCNGSKALQSFGQ